MAFGVIVPDFWNDEKITERTPVARLIAAFLLTASEAVLIPGLVNLGVAGLAEAVRVPLDVALHALNELRGCGFCQTDPRARLIRIPNAPRYAARGMNRPLLFAWFKRWSAMPASPLKAEHVASIRAALEPVSSAPWFDATWRETFGTVPVTVNPTVASQCPHSDPHRDVTVGVGVGVSVCEGVLDLPPEQQPARQQPLRLVPEPEPAPRDGVTLDDLERVYEEYPRKEGKKRGLSIARSQVRTQEDLGRLRTAVRAYATKVRSEGREMQHVKHFATFMGCWQDYLDARVAAPLPRAGPDRGLSAREIWQLAEEWEAEGR